MRRVSYLVGSALFLGAFILLGVCPRNNILNDIRH